MNQRVDTKKKKTYALTTQNNINSIVTPFLKSIKEERVKSSSYF